MPTFKPGDRVKTIYFSPSDDYHRKRSRLGVVTSYKDENEWMMVHWDGDPAPRYARSFDLYVADPARPPNVPAKVPSYSDPHR